MTYNDMCYDCGEKTYGKPKRDLGAITVSMGICPMCKEEKGIVPARDFYYAYEERVSPEDWD